MAELRSPYARGRLPEGRQRRSPLAPVPIARQPRLPPRAGRPVLRRGPLGLQASLFYRPTPYPPPPAGFLGTTPEWAVYWALLALGKRPGVDFDFQSSLAGGRLEYGGLTLDFRLYDPPGLGINVLGLHWHYELGSRAQAQTRLEKLQLAQHGVEVVWIDEDHALSAPLYYTAEALAGRDHSRLAQEG